MTTCARCKRRLARVYAEAGGMVFGPKCAVVMGIATVHVDSEPKVRKPGRQRALSAEDQARQYPLWPEVRV